MHPHKRSVWAATLLLATFTHTALAKRGGGGGDSGGDSGGGGDDSGGSSGGSISSGYCPSAKSGQEVLRHAGPVYSRYFDGKVTITYKLDQVSDTIYLGVNAVDGCNRADSKTHKFSYDATLRVSGYVDQPGGKFTGISWTLRAFQNWGVIDYLSSGYNPDPPLREVVLLNKYATYQSENFRSNGTRDDLGIQVEAWKTETIPRYNSTTGELEDVDLINRFVSNPLESSLTDDEILKTTYKIDDTPLGNFIPLDEVCATGFEWDKTVQERLLVAGRAKAYQATIFLQPEANMTATINGLFSDTARFQIANGSFVRAIGGGLQTIPCYFVYDNQVSEYNINSRVWDLWSPYVDDRNDYPPDQWVWNATGTFQLDFTGNLNTTASKNMIGFDNDTALPIFSESGSGAISGRHLSVFGVVVASAISGTLIFSL